MKQFSLFIISTVILNSCGFLWEEEPEIETIVEDAIKYEGKK